MKISVIVPVYNAERYIKKCISSVMRQTYSDWELLMIDDGSTDGSGDLIDIAAKKDSRIIAVHQKNAGPGEARNRGIEMATGDFVAFLDADDFIDKEYFALLLPKTKEHDVIYIDINQVSGDGKLLVKEYMSKYKKLSKERFIRSQMTGKIPWGGVRKAVSLKLLRDNNIGFTSHSVGEEALYSFRVLHAAASMSFIDKKPVYFYVNHEGSQSKLRIADPLGEVVSCLRNYLLEQGLYRIYADTVNAFNLSSTLISLDRIEWMYTGERKRNEVADRMRFFAESYDNSADMDYESLSYKAKLFAPFLQKGICRPVLIASRVRKLL